jgi:hypothetical protein
MVPRHAELIAVAALCNALGFQNGIGRVVDMMDGLRAIGMDSEIYSPSPGTLAHARVGRAVTR